MSAALCLMLAPVVSGQIYTPPIGGGRGGVPPIVVSPQQGAGAPNLGSGLGSTPNLKPSLPDFRTPTLNIDTTTGRVPGGSTGDQSNGGTVTESPSTDSGDDTASEVRAMSAITAPPPLEADEPPPDGGDDDQDGRDSDESKGFPWKTIVILLIVGLFFFGLTKSGDS